MTTFSNVDSSVFDSTPEILDLKNQMDVIKLAGLNLEAIKANVAGQLFTGGIGYDPTLRGSITQLTDKSTSVTLNSYDGLITTAAASLAADTKISFTLTNTLISQNDMILVHRKSGGTSSAYTICVDSVTDGSCSITIHNTTTGALAEALVIKFAILKA